MIGIESFKKYFKGFEREYAIIGGTACELLMSEKDLDFRATKDIDMVLIIEALSKEFAKVFWKYVSEAQYEHIHKGTGKTEFYRFYKPKSSEYPMMIELFSKSPKWMIPTTNHHIVPIHVDNEISSLSAILLNDDYYDFLRKGIHIIDGISILDAEHMIRFKAKAWLDLKERKERGNHVDSRDIKKYKNDVIRLSMLLVPDNKIEVLDMIKNDLSQFIQNIDKEDINLKQLGILNIDKKDFILLLSEIYGLSILQNV